MFLCIQILDKDPGDSVNSLDKKKEASVKKLTAKDPMKDGDSDDSDEVTPYFVFNSTLTF